MLLHRITKLIRRIFRGRQPLSDVDLRKLGARVGTNFSNYSNIDMGHAYLLTIGNNVTLSACRILLHDGSTKGHWGYSRVGRVEIGDNVFVGADAVILPNVKIGSNVVIGAGSVVVHDIPDNCVAVGNPCKPIKPYDEFIAKNDQLFATAPKFEHYFEKKTTAEKNAEYELLKNGGIGFDI